ncbi:uncharacterized protein EKO05_0003311 [Ascochyta rabiei]|uniref:Uncharacterized protein n=1 Tax=Didymella rabiei TaxID=5454 RepID=A0A163E0G0_DIDRA|nr:uncharacterized protein EKO05_0003311 [Ascochyta rabiei]KZM23441.1 hypothetical protein ST47_g5409 [Ascochyta rabiei]UPX12773.1 hypothetical protein EKO05_0003311 [Ascochyta rabiei]
MDCNNLVEILRRSAEDNKKACEAALVQPVPTVSLRPAAAEFVPTGVYSSPPSEAAFLDEDSTSYYEYVGYSLPYTPPTPPSLQSDVEEPKCMENSASEVSEAPSPFAGIDYSTAMYGSGIQKWPAVDRADLNPSSTVTLRFRTTRGTHNIPVPKLPLIAVSPRIRAAFVENPALERMTFFMPNMTPGAIRAIARWLKNICKDAEAREIRIPETAQSWQKALELRMTAMELGMEQYVEHIGAGYLPSLVGRELDFDEARILVKSARGKDDKLLVAFANSLAYLVRYHKLSGEEEAILARHLSRQEWAPLLEAIREDGVKALRRIALGLD